jgi:hypothetical protein
VLSKGQFDANGKRKKKQCITHHCCSSLVFLADLLEMTEMVLLWPLLVFSGDVATPRGGNRVLGMMMVVVGGREVCDKKMGDITNKNAQAWQPLINTYKQASQNTPEHSRHSLLSPGIPC